MARGHFLALDVRYELGQRALSLALGAGEVAGDVADLAVLTLSAGEGERNITAGGRLRGEGSNLQASGSKVRRSSN
jgi:hypothetical protein